MLRRMSGRSCLHVQSAYRVSASRCCSCGGQMRNALRPGKQAILSASIAPRGLRAAAWLFLPLSLLGSALSTRLVAQQSNPAPMRLTLDQAINLALKQNRSVRLRALSVEQMQSKKDAARSDYMPQITATGHYLYLTELEGIEIPAGSLGSFPSTGPVPGKALFIGQGSDTSYTGGVGLDQPLTQLLRIHQANVAARQDVLVAKTQLDETQDAIALQVRQLYYDILINAQELEASQDQLTAAQVKNEE